jgi:hypothetical protein
MSCLMYPLEIRYTTPLFALVWSYHGWVIKRGYYLGDIQPSYLSTETLLPMIYLSRVEFAMKKLVG